MLIVKASRCILDRLIKLFAQWYNERLKSFVSMFCCYCHYWYLCIIHSINRSSECATKLKPSDIFSHSYLVVYLFRKFNKEAFECQKWGKSFEISLEGRGKSITKWRKFLATFMGHIPSLWIVRASVLFVNPSTPKIS